MKVRVMTKSNEHGVRPGQVYMDRLGRVLWVQNVVEQIERALCFVLNHHQGHHLGAALRFGRLGRLVKDVDAVPCSHCSAPSARMLDPKDHVPFCGPQCWTASGRGAAASHGPAPKPLPKTRSKLVNLAAKLAKESSS